ncbi:MAG TPA: FXSXX-COOH protein [Micromonosporaceae bacterium]|nr:FXSXX-COOH protein [Micromonosporaceae bacterium]
MDELAEEDGVGLIDLTDISLTELQHRDDSPFAHCLRRVVHEREHQDELTMVAFESVA